MKIKLILLASILFFVQITEIYPHDINSNTPWINFTDMKNVIAVSADNSRSLIYCGTTGGLFVVNMDNGNILKKFTNIDGLITTNITSMIIDNFGKLWIGGSDGSISILDYNSLSWNYIYDIKNSNESNKIINGFASYNNFIFVATGFGIEKVSSITHNFVDAPYYQLGYFTTRTKVNTLTVENNTIFAGTASGIAYANLNLNLNLPSNWTNYTSPPMYANVRIIQAFNNKVFAGSDSGFVYFDNQNWFLYPNGSVSNLPTSAISPVGNKLFFVTAGSIYLADKDSLSNIRQYFLSGNNGINVIASDKNNNPLFGMIENGLILRTNNNNLNVYPNGPFRNSFNTIGFDDTGLLLGAGGLGDAGYYTYDGNTWKNYNNTSNPILPASNDYRKVLSRNGITWALNFGNGIVASQNNTYYIFNTLNAPLPGISAGSTFCVPIGGAFDNNGLFWCTFYLSAFGKSLYVNTGGLDSASWLGFLNIGSSTTINYESMAIDNYNTKWIVSRDNAKGVYFFNENNTLFNTSDDIYGYYPLSVFSVNDILNIIVDKNNTVWIATDNGVFIVDNPLGAIQNPSNPPAPQKLGIISGNLKVPFTESCESITVDVLNQKWIGTQTNGVFHLSDDGSTLIEQFNVSNSPILSNEIKSIAIDPRTGRAYFATINGLSSVQTNAIQPVSDFDKITCSPNPYLLPPKVDMKIDGLVENSSVKIITLTGDIVIEFDSPGGRIATWNGLDKRGNYVPSGIYIVVAYNKDGSKVGKGKVAIIRR